MSSSTGIEPQRQPAIEVKIPGTNFGTFLQTNANSTCPLFLL
jgi:hypothetical protein